MTKPPRDIAIRLGIDQLPLAQRTYRTAESLRYFRRGFHFGAHFPPARATAPAIGATNDLRRYAEAHGEGPGLYKWPHYFEIYDRHLAPFRGQAITLVEVGVAGGGSIGMWRNYLGPDAQIVGIDIDPGCRRFEAEGVEILIGDQGSGGFWGSFLRGHEKIDIVIDDGGHLPEQQVATLESLLPAITPGGVYVCEDIHGPLQPFQAYVDGLTRPLSDIDVAGAVTPANSLQQQIASVHRYPLVTVIEKVRQSPDQFECRRYGTHWPEDWVQ
jgi:hypothetical protein